MEELIIKYLETNYTVTARTCSQGRPSFAIRDENTQGYYPDTNNNFEIEFIKIFTNSPDIIKIYREWFISKKEIIITRIKKYLLGIDVTKGSHILSFEMVNEFKDLDDAFVVKMFNDWYKPYIDDILNKVLSTLTLKLGSRNWETVKRIDGIFYSIRNIQNDFFERENRYFMIYIEEQFNKWYDAQVILHSEIEMGIVNNKYKNLKW